MSTAVIVNGRCRGRLNPAPPKKARSPWITILAALALLMIFMFVIGPWGLQTETMKPVADAIEDYGIEANAYYYTEVPEFFDAQMFFSNNRRFSHK